MHIYSIKHQAQLAKVNHLLLTSLALVASVFFIVTVRRFAVFIRIYSFKYQAQLAKRQIDFPFIHLSPVRCQVFLLLVTVCNRNRT